MALVKANINQGPKDSYKVTEQEALLLQWNIIKDWKPKSDVWALFSGTYAVAAMNGITGLYVNNFYRKKLKLGKYGIGTTYIPTVFLPALVGALFHSEFVTSNILLGEWDCPVCMETRAAALNISVGILQPIIIGPISSFLMADRYEFVRIPSIISEKKKLWNFHREMARPLYRNLSYFVAANLFLTTTLTYFQMDNMLTVYDKIEKIEKSYVDKEKNRVKE